MQRAAAKQLRTRIVDRLRATQFRPGWVGLLTNPFYFARSGLYAHIAQLSPRLHGRLLDVGCGQMPYAHLFDVTEYVGLEIDLPETRAKQRAQAFYDGRSFPFPDHSFDSVFASQVFEHVFNPSEFLAEVRRVLRPNGALLMTMPFVWDEHEQPHDFARYSSFGLTHLLRSNGFALEALQKSGADLSAVLQTWGMYAYKALAPGRSWTKLAAAGLLTMPVNLLGRAALPLFPRNPDLFLDLVVLARKTAM